MLPRDKVHPADLFSKIGHDGAGHGVSRGIDH
jgi:hypothetical protein